MLERIQILFLVIFERYHSFQLFFTKQFPGMKGAFIEFPEGDNRKVLRYILNSFMLLW